MLPYSYSGSLINVAVILQVIPSYETAGRYINSFDEIRSMQETIAQAREHGITRLLLKDLIKRLITRATVKTAIEIKK